MAYAQCCLSLASHLGAAFPPLVPVPPASFGFSGSWSRCRFTSIIKGTSFLCRIPHYPCGKSKGRKRLSWILKACLMGSSQLSFAGSYLCSLPIISDSSTACLVDFHQIQKETSHIISQLCKAKPPL